MTAPALPVGYTIPGLFGPWLVEFDSAMPTQTRFQDYAIIVSGIVRNTDTGATYRVHFSAARSGHPDKDQGGVQLNYLGKRRGAPVLWNHVRGAWDTAIACWREYCEEMRDAPGFNDIAHPAEHRALARARRDRREEVEADSVRRASKAQQARDAVARVQSGEGAVSAWDIVGAALLQDHYNLVPETVSEPTPLSVSPAARAHGRLKLRGWRCAECNAPSVEGDSGVCAACGATASKLGEITATSDLAALPVVEVSEVADAMFAGVRTIDCTPTWAAILPMIRAGIENGTPEGRRIAWEELARMADAADMWNASRKADGN